MPDNVRIGKSYRVQVELGQPEDAVVIPKGNFFQYTGGQWIYKLDESGNRAVKVPITVGRQNPRQYEIIEGLKAGDRGDHLGLRYFWRCRRIDSQMIKEQAGMLRQDL